MFVVKRALRSALFPYFIWQINRKYVLLPTVLHINRSFLRFLLQNSTQTQQIVISRNTTDCYQLKHNKLL